jgi:ubiquinone/menaquinone biosynthesis C-methylase UbiE
MMDLVKYRGQWGGKIENGEEMWWSEPQRNLQKSRWARFRFALDVRHHFILRFWRKVPETKINRPLLVVDYGCGTGGTTLNFSQFFGNAILGVDVFETQLVIAREFAKKQGIHSRFQALLPGGKIPVNDTSVDVIMSLDVLGHVPHVPTVLAEFARSLKPGGRVLLFTESTYSENDHSLMSKLARAGADMMLAVPEHISLFPKEVLEEMFRNAGFQVKERFSSNVCHFFFFPKDYVTLLRGKPEFKMWFRIAWLWDRISKLSPFYPWPFQVLRLCLTYLFGKKAYGTSYYYHLEKNANSIESH